MPHLAHDYNPGGLIPNRRSTRPTGPATVVMRSERDPNARGTPVNNRNRHYREKKGSGGRELGSLVTEIAQVWDEVHREVVVDPGHLECRTRYRERWGPRGELGSAGRPALDPISGIRDLAGRGDSFEDAADSELNWTERPGEPRRWWYACNEVLVDVESALTSRSWTWWLVASGIDKPVLG
jgi:hypothetical protein